MFSLRLRECGCWLRGCGGRLREGGLLIDCVGNWAVFKCGLLVVCVGNWLFKQVDRVCV
jgi:hypothetical protein